MRIEVEVEGSGIDPSDARPPVLAVRRAWGRDDGHQRLWLGLALTKSWSRRLGGDIGVVDAAAGGSIFWIELPAAQAPTSVSPGY